MFKHHKTSLILVKTQKTLKKKILINFFFIENYP